MISWFKRKITGLLVRYLTAKVRSYQAFAVSSPENLQSMLQVGDVILVEGNQRFSTAVKYLTQSSPYFKIVKPTIERGFDYRNLDWGNSSDEETERPA